MIFSGLGKFRRNRLAAFPFRSDISCDRIYRTISKVSICIKISCYSVGDVIFIAHVRDEQQLCKAWMIHPQRTNRPDGALIAILRIPLRHLFGERCLEFRAPLWFWQPRMIRDTPLPNQEIKFVHSLVSHTYSISSIKNSALHIGHSNYLSLYRCVLHLIFGPRLGIWSWGAAVKPCSADVDSQRMMNVRIKIQL